MSSWLNSLQFAQPMAFWLFIIPAVMILWFVLRKKATHAELSFSSLKGWINAGKSIKPLLHNSLIVLRVLAVSLLILAIARPQSILKEELVSTEGIDIILALDVSGSMLAMDFEPNRLEASKEKAILFLSDRPSDRIGLVVFSGESFTQCPLTTDHLVLKEQVAKIREGLMEDGTAIGMGLATAITRLKDSDAKSKVIILLTDGDNNAGLVEPKYAAELARELGVRIYTIGVGTKGKAKYPFKLPDGRIIYQMVEVVINEELLTEVAMLTGGKYFRATDNESLQQIYDEIDILEKARINVATVRRESEEFFPFALVAAILLLLEWLLRYSWLKTLT